MGLKRDYRRHSDPVTRSARWPAPRQAALDRDGYACRSCGRRGRLEVDHIRPVRTHPAGAFNLGNLQSLCASCHARKARLECGFPDLSPARRAWRDLLAALIPREEPRYVDLDHDFSPAIGNPTKPG